MTMLKYILGTFIVAILCSSKLAQADSALDTLDPNVQPFMDDRWIHSKCKFHVLRSDGAYGNHNVDTLEGCVAAAEIGLITYGKAQDDDQAFHSPAQVDFIDERNVRHSCRLESKKEHYDVLPNLLPNGGRDLNYDTVSLALKSFLDENFSVICDPKHG
jgi:hypothetical protein